MTGALLYFFRWCKGIVWLLICTSRLKRNGPNCRKSWAEATDVENMITSLQLLYPSSALTRWLKKADVHFCPHSDLNLSSKTVNDGSALCTSTSQFITLILMRNSEALSGSLQVERVNKSRQLKGRVSELQGKCMINFRICGW